ncbi:MAG: GNAT family N-acetyltransferase [Pseudomonadota bacterium]
MNEQLTFESLKPEHATALFELFQSEEIFRYIPEQPHATLQSMQDEINSFIAGPRQDSGEAWLNWGILYGEAKKCIGTLQATLFADGSLWIGYKLAQAYWGKGIATQSVSWLTGELHRRYPDLAIHASVDTRNGASIRVLEKIGFEVIRREAAELHGLTSEDLILCATNPKPYR